MIELAPLQQRAFMPHKRMKVQMNMTLFVEIIETMRIETQLLDSFFFNLK